MVETLIITKKNDAHAKIVFENLIKKGISAARWFSEEFIIGNDQLHYHSSEDKFILVIDQKTIIDLDSIEVVWFRRPKFPFVSNSLHREDGKFVETENRMNMKAIWQTLGASVKWINPLNS